MLLLQHQLPSGQYIYMDPDQVEAQSHISEQCCDPQFNEHNPNLEYFNMYLNNSVEYCGTQMNSSTTLGHDLVEYSGSNVADAKDLQPAPSEVDSCDDTVKSTQLEITNGLSSEDWHTLPDARSAPIAAHCAATPPSDCAQVATMLSPSNNACSVICATPTDHFTSYPTSFCPSGGSSTVGQDLTVMETVSAPPCAEDVLHPSISYSTAATPLPCQYDFQSRVTSEGHPSIKCERIEQQRGDMYWSGMSSGYYTAPITQSHSYVYDAREQSSMSSMFNSYRSYREESPCHSPTTSTGSAPLSSSIPSTSSQTVPASIAQHKSSTGGQSKRNKKVQLFCAVCGDVAACQHYGVRTCEGCKGFFKRTVQKSAKYVCSTGLNNCVVDKRRRNRCQFCRFQKCINLGMAPEVVRTDALKGRRGRLPSKMRNSSVRIGEGRPQSGSGIGLMTVDPTPSYSAEHSRSPVPTSSILTEALVQAQVNTWGEDNCVLEQVESGEKGRGGNSRETEDVRQMVRLMENCGEKVERFAVGIPGFHQLSEADRMMLVNCSALDVLILHLAYSYNDETEAFAFNADFVLSRHQCHHSMKPWVESIVVLSNHLKSLRVDQSTFACLTAITILSERRNLRNHPQVGFLRNKITSALHEHLLGIDRQHHIKSSAPDMRHLWHQLASQLSYLRTLVNQSVQQLFYLKLYGHVSLPLLVDFVFKNSMPL